MRAMFVLTFSPLGEKVNTIMVLIHQPVKKSTLGKKSKELSARARANKRTRARARAKP